MQGLDLDAEYVPTNTSVDPLRREYPGIQRLGYFLGMVGFGILDSLLTPKGRFDEPSPFIGIVIMAVAFVLVVARLRNIGSSGWWALLALVPVANLWIGFKCLVAQEGYQDAEELDSIGKLLAGIFVGFLILMVLVVLFAVVFYGL